MQRFPPLLSSGPSMLNVEEVETQLSQIFNRYLAEEDKLKNIISGQTPPGIDQVTAICQWIFERFPMQNKDGLFPLQTTESQISDELDNQDFTPKHKDCKFLTILAVYIFSVQLKISTIVSVRVYSEHPILYIKLGEQIYSISFLHSGPKIKHKAMDPFSLLQENAHYPNFLDCEYPETKSILFWRVRYAILLLDAVNIFKRCLLHYAQNPNSYSQIFSTAVTHIQTFPIHWHPFVEFWQSEFERVTEMYKDPRCPKDPSLFYSRIAQSFKE